MDAKHIVVIDDSGITLFKLKSILIQLGYTVTTFTNTLDALDWLVRSGNTPDLIMTDVVMPGMNGIEFVRKLRTFPKTARLPLILLSGHDDMENKIAGLQAGADDFLSKAISPTELELKLKALLSRSQTTEGTISQALSKTISIFSLRGGAGKTTLAVNLSIALTQLWGVSVSLWDLALTSGHCAPMLKMTPKNSLVSLRDWPDEPVEQDVLTKLLLNHETGVHLMPAPISPAEAELVTPRVVDIVWSYLEGNSAYLVIDAGSQFTDPVLTILERSDYILLVLTPELLSVKSAQDALDIFERLNYDLNRVTLVINNIFPTQWLTIKKIAPVFKNRSSFEIPYDSDGFVRASISGEPLIATAPKSEAGLAIISLAYKLSLDRMSSEQQTKSSPLLDWIRKQRF